MTNPKTQLEPTWAGADPFEPSFRDDPYPALNSLRESKRVNLTPVGTYRVTRFEDVKNIFKDANTSMTLSNGESPNFHPSDERGSFRDFVLNLDDEAHLRVRRLLFKSFNNRVVRQFEEEAVTIVEAAMEKALLEGGMDIIPDLAHRVPSEIICRIMGVPDGDREIFSRWTAARTNAFFAKYLPEEVISSLIQAGNEMADYFDAMVKARRIDLQNDFISELIRAEDAGDRMLDGEIVVQAIGIIVAGFETTIGLIGNGTRSLIEHPDQLALLQSRPNLIKNCVEECLRYDTPILFNWRVLREPYEIGDVLLPTDAVIWPMLACANRDPRKFEKPDQFLIARTDVDHQSFGGGHHFCLGNLLAKVEGRVAIGAFAEKTKGIKIKAGETTWSESFFRVQGSYPINFV